MTDILSLQMRFDLPLNLAKILALLNENVVVTADMIEQEHALAKHAKVALHRLRHRLEGTGIEIKSRRDIGYWLTKVGKETLADQSLDHGDSTPAV